MKKQDLKSGMIVELRNGKRFLHVDGIMRDHKGWFSLTDYNDDLTEKYNHNYDIIKVYDDSFTYGLSNIFKDEHLELIWKRKKIKLTDKEIEVLKVLSLLGYEWLARDENDGLYTYVGKPEKRSNGNYWNGVSLVRLRKIETLFNFITWEDDEPTSIDDLLKGV